VVYFLHFLINIALLAIVCSINFQSLKKLLVFLIVIIHPIGIDSLISVLHSDVLSHFLNFNISNSIFKIGENHYHSDCHQYLTNTYLVAIEDKISYFLFYSAI